MTDDAFRAPAMREFAGCELAPLAAPEFFARLAGRLEAGHGPLLIGHHNLHSLHLYHRHPDVQAFYRRCHDCYVDGVGVLWLLKLAGARVDRAHRFSLMDCLPDLLGFAQENHLSVFYLGGSHDAVQRAREWVAEQWPELEIELHHGYVRDDPGVVDRINDFAPDLLLVGMGMPIQERWILAQHGSLEVGAILQAGGTLDYYTGLQARPPTSWSRIGLAWLYRLMRDPRRLWRRYLVTPWSLLRPALRLRRSLDSRRR